MGKKITIAHFFHLIWHILLPLALLLGTSSVIAQEKIYTFGVVPQFEARKLHGIWQPILNFLEKETGYSFKLQGSPSISAFENELMQGRFDFAYMNPFHIVLANQQQAYLPLIRDGGKTLHGVLVVNKNSGINDISQLRGKTIAFPAPNALGASLLLRQELHDTFNIEFKPNYVKTHDSVYLNVLTRQAAAGGGVEKTLKRQKPEYQAALKILHKTTAVSPHPLAVHPMVPGNVADAVKSAFVNMGQSPEGKSLLAKIPIKQIAPATMDDYLPLKKLGLDRFYVK